MSPAFLAVAARRVFSPDPEFGLGTTDHLTPSQCSTRVRKLVVVFSKKPNAQAFFAVMATTAASALVVWKPAAGFGLGTIVQRAPFQCSIRVLNAPPLLYEPTAQTSLAEVAATALSVADPLVGLGLTVHTAQARGAAIAGDPAAMADKSKVAVAATPVVFLAIHDGMSAPLDVSALPVWCDARPC